jgi:hypothetical protein
MARYALWEQAGSYAAGVDRRLIASIWPVAASTGCAVTAVAGQMQVNVAPGAVAVPAQNATGSTLCVSDAVEVVPIGGASAQNRIDLVICRPRATDLDGGTNNDMIFDTVAGVPSASPVAPAVPAGTVALAQVLVPTGSVAVTAGNITDARPAGLAPPRGYVASLWGPASLVNCGGAFSTVMTLAVPVILGRRYRLSAYGNSQQITASSTNSQVQVIDDQSQSMLMAISRSIAVGVGLVGAVSMLYVPTATKTASFSLQGVAGAGSLQFAANTGGFLMLEDIGSSV